MPVDVVHKQNIMMSPALPPMLVLPALLILSGCAQQSAQATQSDAPGFLQGLLHGFIFPFAWVLSLFMDNVAIYAVPNNGGWYDFGYFLGVCVLGVGSHGSRKKG